MPKPKVADLIPLRKIPDLLYELTGVTRKKATIYLWARKGIADAHGELVKLKVHDRLGQHYTTKQALIDFISRLG